MGVRIANVEEKSLKQIYEENKNVLGSEKDLIKVLGEELYARKQAEDAQTKFNKALDLAKESFAKLAESGTIDKFATILTQFVNAISSGKSIIGALFGSSKVYTKEEAQKELDTITSQVSGDATKSARYKETKRSIEGQGFKVEGNKVIDADDFTIRTHPKDELVIAGGTNLSGGSNQEMIGLLQKLVSSTEQSRQVTVSVDGERVFSAMGRVPMK